jgi:hypothetical protein
MTRPRPGCPTDRDIAAPRPRSSPSRVQRPCHHCPGLDRRQWSRLRQHIRPAAGRGAPPRRPGRGQAPRTTGRWTGSVTKRTVPLSHWTGSVTKRTVRRRSHFTRPMVLTYAKPLDFGVLRGFTYVIAPIIMIKGVLTYAKHPESPIFGGFAYVSARRCPDSWDTPRRRASPGPATAPPRLPPSPPRGNSGQQRGADRTPDRGRPVRTFTMVTPTDEVDMGRGHGARQTGQNRVIASAEEG